jgi:hypothetical protein
VTARTPLQWDGTTATGDGVRYGITRDRQAMIWLVWRTVGSGPRCRIGEADTLEQARALAESDHTGGQ